MELEEVSTTTAMLKRAFPGVSIDGVQDMLRSGKMVNFPADHVICREGDHGSTLYIILSGGARVTKAMKVVGGNEERLLTSLQPGDFFGEMAIIHGAPRAATITTTSPATMMEFTQESFGRLFKNSKSMSLALVREVSKRLRQNDEMAIRDLRKNANELAEAYDKLANLEKARNEFLTTIAHELRTPLMTASGFLQVIRMGGMQGEALETALGTVSRNIQEIISLTNDILFVQEMDMILPEFQSIDVGVVMASAVENQRAKAERNQVGLHINIAPGLPHIPADSKSLERAFSAMIDNAIKFSPDGGNVTIEVNHCSADSGKGKEIVIEIRDDGVGIPEDALEHIFDRFFHVDKIGEHLFRGAGLGLSIARQAIEQHGGRITVDSVLHKGTTFTVNLKTK